ncbi:VWA domain-containing protein [Candidatus Woesearchaeota archaeon]|nr:VWA domain-containing protein [Candidatus Woesearchaeota archaeon]
MIPDVTGGLGQKRPEELEEIEALEGSLAADDDEQRLMRTVMEHDGKEVDDGKLLAESFDYNLNSFQPDLLFEQLVKDYRRAKKLYGPTMIRELTSYDDEYVEKNINIPEFQQHIQQRITQAIEEMRKRKLLDKEGQITKEGIRLAALIRYTEELDRLTNSGQGKEKRKEHGIYGERAEHENYKKDKHRFHDIDIRRSVRKATRRGHKFVLREDLVATKRKQRGKVTLIYAVDASGSMRGAKIGMAKRAGVALAYQAIQDKNDVGLIIFTSKIETALAPSRDFLQIVEKLTVTRASLETDIAITIEEAMKMFGDSRGIKHLVLLTDALPTKTKENKGPQRRVLEAVSAARGAGITISLVGISLDEQGEKLARRIVEIGDGKMYMARGVENLNAIILEDYENVQSRE